ncbi:hypothetical protein [Pedobacter cryoconitis]|uniref:DUF8188 domain-containing protein n=1 Tax=Pedobacter cryoconitis TaxID=188932 RepID=A0A327RWT3_9SPHI|nr:hypothetical protein [Pedobacter cryoconitis]RAJ20901.1 hypothetical protein LY11_05103 [Pedobacter cryoconitis]
MGGFIGYTIGAVILLPLLLVGYNYFFLHKNNVNKYIKEYSHNTTDVVLNVPYFNKSALPGDDLVKHKIYTTSLASKNMGRDGSQKTVMRYRIVFDRESKKYFQVTMFDLFNDFWGTLDDNKVYGKVNKEDLNDPNLGNKEKPILVFSVKGFDKPMVGINMNRDSVDYTTSQKQYEYNVLMYLTYAMSKEEFKERFEKGK